MQILIADDHSLFRDGLRHVLSTIAPEVSVTEAGSLDDLMEALSVPHQFELIIVDLSMPGMNGPSSVAEIRQHAAEIPIVVISASEEHSDVREALDSGANGYIPKSARGQVMLSALKLVLVGGIYVPSLILERDEAAAPAPRVESVTPTSLKSLLTERQLDVLRLLAKGRPNKEIARQLNLAEGTVRVHVNAVLKALSARNRTEAALVARNAGLL
jgi:DNA-binding NarL/FixJ family response regulator